jgi:hypothetical protein
LPENSGSPLYSFPEHTVTWRLKAEIVKSEKTAIARQRLVEKHLRHNGESKHVFMATANNKEWISEVFLYNMSNNK